LQKHLAMARRCGAESTFKGLREMRKTAETQLPRNFRTGDIRGFQKALSVLQTMLVQIFMRRHAHPLHE
jgi:hypothetical protein